MGRIPHTPAIVSRDSAIESPKPQRIAIAMDAGHLVPSQSVPSGKVDETPAIVAGNAIMRPKPHRVCCIIGNSINPITGQPIQVVMRSPYAFLEGRKLEINPSQ